MRSQNSSRSAVIIQTITGKIASVFGWIGVVFFVMLIIIALSSDPNDEIHSSLNSFYVFLFFSVVVILCGNSSKRMVKRFKQYVGIILEQNEYSIEKIAAITSQPANFVMRDIKMMISRGFFVNTSIDSNTREIILANKSRQVNQVVEQPDSAAVKSTAVTCKGCGAIKRINMGSTSDCDFCGSLLHAK